MLCRDGHTTVASINSSLRPRLRPARASQQAQQQDQEFRSYVQEAAASSPASPADQLAKLADLRDRGVISAEEFDREKDKLLAA